MGGWRSWWCGLLVALAAAAALIASRSDAACWRGTGGCSSAVCGSRRATPGAGWVLGMARYNAEMLEWFRFFSYSDASAGVLPAQRGAGGRTPRTRPVEAVALYAGQRVVELVEHGGPGVAGRTWELAMATDSLTGLLSWLEAAPPRPAGPLIEARSVDPWEGDGPAEVGRLRPPPLDHGAELRRMLAISWSAGQWVVGRRWPDS